MSHVRSSFSFVKNLTLVFLFILSFSSLKAQYNYDGINPAHLITSWTGSPTDFNSGTFNILAGQSAQVSGAMTLGAAATMNVQSGGRLFVTNGVTFTNNGTLNIAGGGTLELQGSGAVNGANAVTYQAVNSLLLYTGAVAKTTTAQELPATMPGSLQTTNTFGIILGSPTDVQGTFTSNQIIRLNTTLTASGPINFVGTTFFPLAGSTFVIAGTGAISGTLSLTAGGLNNLTINRAGAVVNLGATVFVNNQLTLTNGILRPAGNFLVSNNVSTAIAGGSNTSYIDCSGGGSLVWRLPANMTSGPNYTFPVGTGTQYLPFRLLAPTTGTGAFCDVSVQATNTGTGGSPDCSTLTSLSTTEYLTVGAQFATLTAGMEFTAPSVGTGSVFGQRLGAPVTGTYSAPPGTPTVLGNTLTNTTPYTFGAHPGSNSRITVAGNAPAPTYTMTTSGDPNVLTNWSGSPPSFAVPCAEYVIPNGITAVMTGIWTLGSAAVNGVRLTVQSGGTLNTGTAPGNAVRFAGNNAVITLQNGANFITANSSGVNGNSDGTGAIQVIGGATGFVTNYGSLVNFSFGAVSPSGTCLFAAAGQKLAIPQVASLTINTPFSTSWSFNSALTVANALTVVSGNLFFQNSLVLNGIAGSSNVQGPNGSLVAQVAGVLTITNPGALTVQNGGTFGVSSTAPIPCVITNDVAYQTGGMLDYIVITVPRTTGRELPSAMNGILRINGGSAAGIITLGAATAINNSGVLNLSVGTSPLVTSAANMLTINNSAVGAVLGGNASYVAGPMRRAIPSGANTGTWLFPVGKGVVNLPFSIVNPNTGGVSVVEVEAFNVGSGGTADGVTAFAPLGSEYWRSEVVSGSFTSGFMRIGKTGLVAENVIGSSTTLAGTYTSNGANTFAAGTPPTLTRTVSDNLAVPTFFAAAALPSTYYYISGSPYTASNWNSLVGGTGVPAISLSGQNWTYIIPNGRTVTVTGVDLIIGSGASASQVIVQAGGTLDVPNGIGFAIGGNGGAFTLQAGGTIRARGGAGINGISNATGALQIFAGSPATVTVTYDPAANYIFSNPGSGPARTGAAGVKPAVTVANNVTVDAGGVITLDASLTVNGNLTINAAPATAGLSLAGASPQVLTLNGAANQIQAGQLTVGANFTIANTNPGGLTVLNGATVNVGNATIPFVSGNEFAYNAGGILNYQNTVPMTTGLEFPATMNGNVTVNAGGATPTVTLNAARTLGASSTLTLTAGRLVTSGANIVTVNNTASAAVMRTNGMVEGPMRRAIPAGGPTAGTWLFPVSKGATYLPFALVDPTSVGGSVVETEAFNTNPVGTADGTTIQTGTISTTEYWRANVFSGGAITARMLLGRTTLAATQTVGSAAAIGGPYSAPSLTTYNNLAVDNLTQNTAQTLSSPNFFAVGTFAPPTTYYYHAPSGAPHLATSWWSGLGGTGIQAANMTTSGWTFIVPDGVTATATANIALSAGVTLRVAGGPTGGTLNIPNTFAVTGAGSFALQANGTLQTSRTDGVNGTFAASGAIQVTGSITYDIAANYILSAAAAATANFAAVAPNKPPITQAQNLTRTGGGMTTLSTGLALSGALTINASTAGNGLRLVGASAGQVLTLTGAGSQLIQGTLELDANFTIANNNAVTPLAVGAMGQIFVRNPGVSVNYVTGQPISYVAGGILAYTGNIPLTTGLELPSPMLGNIAMSGTAGLVVNLGAATTLNGILNFNVNGQFLQTTPTNLLTIANTAPAAISGTPSGTAHVIGPLARAIQAGGGTYTFPLGGGSAATYIPAVVNYATANAGTIVTVSPFNTACPGSAGTGIGSVSATEYWSVGVNALGAVNNATLTFQRASPATTGQLLGSSGTANGSYNSVPATIPTATTIRNTTPFATIAGGTTTFYTIGSPMAIYYFQLASGNANTPGNWNTLIGGGGTPGALADFTTAGRVFVIPTGRTANLSAPLAFGAGVTLQVANGGTLNIPGGVFAVTGAGSFQLQAGGTLQTARTDGVNGTSGGTGAIQTASATYDNAANYVFDLPGSTANLNFAVQGAKNAITAANNITFTAPGPIIADWTLATPLTISGALNMTFTQLRCDAVSSSVLTLSGASTFNTQGGLRVGANFQVNNGGTMTLNANAFLVIRPTTALPIPFIGNTPVYASTARLSYAHSVPMTTGAELPSTMPGTLALNGTAALTLAAGTTTITGILDPGSTLNSPLNTGSGNMLRIDQAVGGGISANQGLINGPVQLNLPVGTYSGAWIPVSKGGTPLWASVTFTSPSGGLIEIEAYNTGSGGSADATSITTVNATEHWRFTQLSGMPMTVTPIFVTAAGAGAAKAIASSTTLGGTYTSSGPATYSAFGFYGIPYNQATVPIPLSAATTYFTLGNGVPTYYYNNANVNIPVGPNNPANWDTTPGVGVGTAAPNFTTAGTAFSIDAGSTAVLTADLPFGAGANNVTLTVPSGATLNTGVYAVQFAGNNSRFNLQNGATLQTSHTSGINGIGNNDGAVQIIPPATGVVISYGPTANYVLGAIGATTDARFADFSGNKQAITQAASLTVNPGALRTWILSGGPLTLSGALTVQSGTLALGSSILTFGGAGSIVQNAAALQLNSGAQIVNTGGLTIQSGGRFEVAGVTTLPIVATNPITYDGGSFLSYFGHPVLSTGLEFPASMNGSVSIQTGGPLTLNGAKSVNGTFSISGTGALITDNTNMLTIANTADVAVVRSGSGEVRGPMRRALPAGASPGLQWLFPVSKGGTYLPFAVNSPTTAGGATIEVEAYNTAPAGGSADGTTVIAPLGAEHWRAEVTSLPGTFTSGFMQAARAGLTATNLLGSTTTAPPTATTYSSNGANTLGTLTAVSSLTRTVADNLAAPTYFAVGTAIITYYYNNANINPGGANNRLNWDTSPGAPYGTAAPNFTTANTVFSIDPGSTAVLTADLPFGAGANNVTLTVPSGATLNTDIHAVQFAGNNSRFNLQNGGTLQTSHPSGINGIGNSDGAVQINPPLTTGVVISYGPTANYVLGAISATTDARFGDISGNKQAIIQAASLTVNPGASRTWILSGVPVLTLSGALTVQSGILTLSLPTLNLSAAGSTVQSGASLIMNVGSQISNTGGLTVQNLASLWIEAGTPATWVTGTPVTYNTGSQLIYNNITSPLTATGLELPGTMFGTVALYGAAAAGVLTLSSPTTIAGAASLLFGANGRLNTSSAMLTLNNPSPGALSRTGSGYIDGPFRRALLPGASIGQQWLFPIGKGGTYLPFAVNDPTTAGGATIEVEAYNAAPAGGSADGSTVLAPLGAEYWRAQVASGTFTSGFMQAARTGLTATNIIGGTTTAPPAVASYSSNGTNNVGTLTAVSSLRRTVADNLAAPTYFAVGTDAPPPPMNVQNNVDPFTAAVPVVPARNVANAPLGTTITIPFSQNLNAPSVIPANFPVHGAMGGRRTAAPSFVGNTVTLAASAPNFLRGEQVWVSVTNAQSTGGINTRPFVYSFRAAAAGTGTGNFVDARRYPTVPLPVNAIAGQFDNGAGVDFAVASENISGIVKIYRNDGTGNFPPATNIVDVTVGQYPVGLETGDFDNDGFTDLIVICRGSVWFIKNNNNGTYAPSLVNSSTRARLFGAVADFNADGNLDVAYVNNGSAGTPGTEVYLGQGNGTFIAGYSVAQSGVAIDAADMDADGDIDIITAADGATPILVFRNDGTGQFDGGTAITGGIAVYNMQVAELNGDAYPDVVYTTLNAPQQNVNVLLSNGAGGLNFLPLATYPITNAVIPGTQLADIDGDGDLDILAVKSATTNGEENSVYTLKNNGSGVFSMFASSPLVGRSADALTGFAAADFDGDGDLDLVIPKTGDAQVAVVLNQTPRLQVTGIVPAANAAAAPEPITISPTFNLAVTGATYSLGGPIAVHGGMSAHRNITSGGAWAGSTFTPNNIPTLTRKFFPGEKIDVMISSSSTLAVGLTPLTTGTVRQAFARVLSGPGTFQLTQLVSGGGGNTRAVASGDWDNNGVLDLVMVNQNAANNIRLMMNNGSGNFTPQVAIAVPGIPSFPISGDFDNDGNLDVIVSSLGTNNAYIYRNSPAGTLTNVGAMSLIGLDNIASGDFNGDGLLDVVATCGANGVRVARNNGGMSFTTYQTIAVGNVGTCAAGDFDSDGDIDIVYSLTGSTTVGFLQNDGKGNFNTAPFTLATAGATRSFFSVGDLDSDGDIDLAIGGNGVANAVLLENTSSGGTLNFTVITTTLPSSDITLTDINGDGNLDLAAVYLTTANTLLNSGSGALSGRFTGTVLSTPISGTTSFCLTSGDFDNDGDMDIATANHGSGDVSILLNQVPPTVFYYQSGNANNPANWNSLPWGGGTPATAFSSPATDFYVMGGSATTTASVIAPITIGANVSMHVTTPSVLAIGNGVTITNNGFVNVSGNTIQGATLQLVGSGAVTGNAVTYWGTTATLEYQTILARATTNVEFPSPMQGSVLINGSNTVSLNANRQITGTLTVQAGTFDISGRTLQPNGAIVFSGGTINGSAAATLDIAGAGNITGSALFTGIMGSLSMNRAGATLSLGSPLDISAAGLLTLNQGFIQTTPTNILRTTNSAAGAIVGASAASHVVGPLRRFVGASGTYSFPVGGGTAATYNPATLTYTAGGGTVEVEPFFTAPPSVLTSGLMGSLGSASEYWRVTPSMALTNADLTFQRVPGMTNGVNLLGVAPAAAGTYNGYTSTVAGSTIVNTTTFPTLAAANGFYAVGTGVTTFFYRGGGFDPNIAGNWYTGLGGTGSPAPNFTGANYIFIVPNMTTAALTGNFTVANTVLLQVATGGVLDVGGFQVTGMGNFDLQNDATLQASNNNGFNGGAIVNTGTRTWSLAANYIFTPPAPYGTLRPLNIATAQVNNLTTLFGGTADLTANLQVNGIFTGGSRLSSCTNALTLGAGAHTQTDEIWLGGTSQLVLNAGATLNLSTAAGAISLVGPGSGCGVGGNVSGAGTINYAANTTLSANAEWVGTISAAALPNPMNGNVLVNAGVLPTTITLGAGVSSQINGTFTINNNGRFNIGAGNSLTLNNAISLSAASTLGGTATSNLAVTGTGTIIGSLAFAGGAQTLNNFTLDRAGANPTLGSPLNVAGTLALTNGVVTNTLANLLTVSNTAPGAVAAGSGYVDGFLERAFGVAGAYTFPVGQGAQALPMTFSDDGTGTGTLVVNAQTGGGGSLGTGMTSLYNTGRWEVRNTIGTRTGTVSLTPSAVVPAVSLVGLSSALGGMYNSIGPVFFAGGASIAQTLPQNYGTAASYLGVGSGVAPSSRYYFMGGNASDPNQWNSSPTGSGSNAPSFLIPGVTFYVMGNTSGISTTVATMQTNTTLGMGAEIVVETPAVLRIPNGVTLTNNGTLTVRGTTTTSATLLLEGNTGGVTGNVVQYGSALARLQYSGSGSTRTTTLAEFPPTMPGTVIVDGNVTVVLDGNKTLQSALLLDGLIDMSNRNVVLQGRLDLRGAFIGNGSSDLEIGHQSGTPATITGSLKIATNILQNFTLNRPNTIVPLGSPLLIQGGFSLARGILRSDTTNYPIIVNPSTSGIVGGNDSSYVEGPLERYFPVNILAGGAGNWLFPVGRTGRYLPFVLREPRTGGNAPQLRVEAFTGAQGGSVDSSLSVAGQGEYWNVVLRAGDHTQSSAELGRFGAGAVPIASGSVVAKAPVQSGLYRNIGGTVAGNSIVSGTFASFSTFTIGTPASGIPPAQLPSISGFGPSTATSGNVITVNGTNLTGLGTVLVGGVVMPYTVVSPTQILIQLTPGAQSGPITVVSTSGSTANSFTPLTFIGPPTMATVSPLAAAVGQEIIIRGNNFFATPTTGEPYLPVVRIGGITASTVEIVSPTEMRVRFPASTSGNVTVQSWGGIATTSTVSAILPPPQVRPRLPHHQYHNDNVCCAKWRDHKHGDGTRRRRQHDLDDAVAGVPCSCYQHGHAGRRIYGTGHHADGRELHGRDGSAVWEHDGDVHGECGRADNSGNHPRECEYGGKYQRDNTGRNGTVSAAVCGSPQPVAGDNRLRTDTGGGRRLADGTGRKLPLQPERDGSNGDLGR
ncbi:MAG: FG-GAP-like repeat-containing protein, partial [Candidatus Kapabacteria bacterium]|nr:FG-GAP-like repeat-containing protein [Candidatus Kapabacteria bacterium]